MNMVETTDLTTVADNPALVEACHKCHERCGLRRHIKEIGDSGRYYAVCYDCS